MPQWKKGNLPKNSSFTRLALYTCDRGHELLSTDITDQARSWLAAESLHRPCDPKIHGQTSPDLSRIPRGNSSRCLYDAPRNRLDEPLDVFLEFLLTASLIIISDISSVFERV